jgi:hypothetical protein
MDTLNKVATIIVGLIVAVATVLFVVKASMNNPKGRARPT